MINKENFKEILEILGFECDKNAKNELYSKSINDQLLSVDFTQERLIYPPELSVESESTSNFSQNENFVVFECVHRLLQRGYKAQDLVLEKTWRLGHSSKSGRADITIFKTTPDKKERFVYAIIECKTAPKEF